MSRLPGEFPFERDPTFMAWYFASFFQKSVDQYYTFAVSKEVENTRIQPTYMTQFIETVTDRF